MVGADDDRRRLPQPPLLQGGEDLTDPMVDHGELGPVVGADLAPLALAQPPRPDRTDVVGRPDQQLAVPVGVVAAEIRRRRVERLVRVELVDEQEEGRVVRRAMPHPVRRRPHRARPGEVLLGAEERARAVVAAVARVEAEPLLPIPPAAARRQRRRPDVARVTVGAPGVALVPAHVVPGAEIRVVVLAARLEEVRVVRHQHRRDAGAAQLLRDGLLPDLDRPPRSPQEVEGPAQDVVARRHARQRAGDVRGEAHGPVPREAVEVRCREFGTAVAAEHVPVEAVEQQDHKIARPAAPARRTGRGGSLVRCAGHGLMVEEAGGRLIAARGTAAACTCRPRPGRRRAGATRACSGPPRAARRRRPSPAPRRWVPRP